MKKIIALLLGLTLVISLVSIGFSSSHMDSEKYGGKIVEAIREEPDTLDVHETTRFVTIQMTSYALEPLFTLNPDFEVIPLLVDSYSWSDDKLTMTINLKQGVMFHNGEEMTSEDVKVSYERYLENSPLANYLPGRKGGITEINTPDKYTVVLKLKNPKPLAMYILADPHMTIMPADWLNNTPEKDIGRTELIGTGPLKFVKWNPGDSITFERFEDYHHGPAYLENQGPAYAEEWVVKIVPEESTRIATVTAGDTDVTFHLPPKFVKSVSAHPNAVAKTDPTYGVQYMSMNSQKEPLTNKNVRVAIAHAVNKDAIVKAAWNGVGFKIYGLINEATVGYWPGIKDVAYKYDLEKAKELLEGEGWVDSDGDGIREKDGKELALTLITFSTLDQWKLAGEIIQAQLKDLGVKIKLETAEVGAIYDRANSGDYDLAITKNMWWLGQPYLNFLTHPENIGSSNYGRWENPELGRLIEEAGNALKAEDREEALNEVQRMVVESGIWVPLVARTWRMAAKNSLGGISELRAHPWWPSLIKPLVLYQKS